MTLAELAESVREAERARAAAQAPGRVKAAQTLLAVNAAALGVLALVMLSRATPMESFGDAIYAGMAIVWTGVPAAIIAALALLARRRSRWGFAAGLVGHVLAVLAGLIQTVFGSGPGVWAHDPLGFSVVFLASVAFLLTVTRPSRAWYASRPPPA